ncbi:unnamed protein product [Cylicocyclus nassatus]|uniref:Uncharacterized protein n=1 Tax=Cylicocyclus nassatus TaxID=53992 RepID=A0AA36M8Z7_CYLNA|nr:unnamed protein product [Cylicocyclus nassatus]
MTAESCQTAVLHRPAAAPTSAATSHFSISFCLLSSSLASFTSEASALTLAASTLPLRLPTATSTLIGAFFTSIGFCLYFKGPVLPEAIQIDAKMLSGLPNSNSASALERPSSTELIDRGCLLLDSRHHLNHATPFHLHVPATPRLLVPRLPARMAPKRSKCDEADAYPTWVKEMTTKWDAYLKSALEIQLGF